MDCADTCRIGTFFFHVEENDSLTEIVEEAKQLTSYKIGIGIHIIYTPILCTFGIAGNSIALYIMLQKDNRLLSGCWYFAAVALYDNLSMFAHATEYIFQAFHFISDPLCKMLVYFNKVGTTGSVMLITLLTVDRFLAVCFPLQFQSFRRPYTARIVILITSVCVCVINVGQIFAADLIDNWLCADVVVTREVNTVLAYLSLLLFFIAPVSTISTLNILIVRRMRQRRKFWKTHGVETGSRHPYTERSTLGVRPSHNEAVIAAMKVAESQMTSMSVVISLSLLLLTLPQHIRYIIYDLKTESMTPDRLATFVLVTNITSKLYSTNNALNCYLYCATGSRFRTDVIKLLHCDRCGCKQQLKCRCCRKMSPETIGSSPTPETDPDHITVHF